MSRRSKESPLTEQQELFCREYIVDLNGTQAAIRAKYSEKTAAEQASRLLTNAKITEKIQGLMKKRLERIDFDADTVLQELLKIALVDIGEAFDETGKLLPIKLMPKHLRQSIASVETFEEFQGRGEEREYIGDTKRVKFWDKTRALELLGKNLKLFTDLKELSGRVTLEDLVAGPAEEGTKDG